MRLVASTGVGAGDPAAPVEGAAVDEIWPVTGVAASAAAELVTGLSERIRMVPAGPWPEPPAAAMVLPLTDGGLGRSVGAIVLGVSARRPFDAEYRRWFELLTAQIGGVMGNARAAEDERRRADALAELDRAKTTFFSNVSHEFRTPLALMLGPLEQALAAEGLPAGSRQHLEVAHRNSQRLLKLVNTLLDFSRIEAGRLQAHQEPADLAALTADIASVFRSMIESAGLRFTVDCPPLGEPIAIDREMWEKVVLNLLSNAFKFTLDGAIAISLRRAADDVVLTVSDTGTGIAAGELPHLFERFHRVRGAGGRSFEGSGIGLALVRELVRLHHGEVHVESVAGQGSTFRVTIPVRHAPHGPDAATGAPAVPRADAAPVSHAAAMVAEASRWVPAAAVEADAADALAARPRVVVADDNADMRDYVAGLLGPTSRVEAVGDGMAALDAIRREPADLLLADVMMPRLDGLELLRTIRADPALRHLPVLLVSARAGEEARVAGLEAGADDYVVKPFGARELIARVGAALELARVRRTSDERLARANRELRDRVTELETLLAVIPVGIGIALDPECRHVQVNPAFATTLGLRSGQNASMTAPDGERPSGFRVLDMNGRELAGEELPLQVAARDGRSVNDVELDVVHDDGRIVRLLEYAAPLLDEHGRPRGAVGAFVDVTDRRRAEVRDSFLVALDDALRTSDDPAAIMVAACRLLGMRLDADRAAYADVEADADRFTIPHEYTRGAAGPSLVGAWSLSEFGERATREIRAGGTLVLHDVIGELGAATSFTTVGIASSIVASTLRDGRLVAMMAVHGAAPRTWRPEEIELVDITAHRCWDAIARARAARVIEASERRYRVVADAMPQLVWTADANGVVDYYSARARAYRGIAVGTWQPMVHPDDLLPTVAAWERALRDQAPYAFEHRLQMADGRFRWHLSRAEPVAPTGGADDRVRWIGTATDVHELRETQERLRLQEEQLRDVDRRKDEFIAILAHELRNPLAPLRTGLDVLRLSHDAAGAVARVRPMMERQVTQMVRLIDDLLDVSRITSGRSSCSPSRRWSRSSSAMRSKAIVRRSTPAGWRRRCGCRPSPSTSTRITPGSCRSSRTCCTTRSSSPTPAAPSPSPVASPAPIGTGTSCGWRSATPAPASAPTPCPTSSSCSRRDISRPGSAASGWASGWRWRAASPSCTAVASRRAATAPAAARRSR
jgi:PAS domain S-box-containing protein